MSLTPTELSVNSVPTAPIQNPAPPVINPPPTQVAQSTQPMVDRPTQQPAPVTVSTTSSITTAPLIQAPLATPSGPQARSAVPLSSSNPLQTSTNIGSGNPISSSMPQAVTVASSKMVVDEEDEDEPMPTIDMDSDSEAE